MTTLVLLPGLDGTEVLLRPLMEALPASVQPLVVTYPSSGVNSYPELLALARRAVARLPACYVLGWSFAGPLALMLAEAEPAKVRGVILSASFVRPPRPLLPILSFALAPPAVWAWRAARRMPLWLFRSRAHPLRRAKSETWRRVSARVVTRRLRAIAGVDARRLLRECRQPVLYLAASDDRIVPGHNGAEVLRLRPSAKRVTIDGPHLAMFTNAAAAAIAITEFIAGGHEAVMPAQEHAAAS